MPSKSESQARLMAAAAHTPGGYGGVPQKVGREFNQADKGGKLLSRAAKDRPKEGKKMARLTPKGRGKIPTSKFAGPGRSYPVEDKTHAKAAIGLAAMHHSPNEKSIDAKAERVLHKGGGSRFDRMSKESSKMTTGKRK
jgi:hypothetical protein